MWLENKSGRWITRDNSDLAIVSDNNGSSAIDLKASWQDLTCILQLLRIPSTHFPTASFIKGSRSVQVLKATSSLSIVPSVFFCNENNI